MKFTIENGKSGFRIDDGDGGSIFTSVSKTILNLEDKERLIEQIILYNEGKVYKTKKAWLGRLNHTLFPAIECLCINALPKTSQGWKELVRQAYASTLTTPYSKAKLTTRVKNWNSNCRPFLIFMKDRDVIPLSVIIPHMKKVGEIKTNSSFNVKWIGQKTPKKETSIKTIDKVLTPIGLHRTDAQYLDEIRFDLERKRDKLLDCLKKYWEAITSHYDFAKNVIANISETEPERMAIYEKGNRYFRITEQNNNGKKYSVRYHIADPNTEGGIWMYLYLLDKNCNGMWKRGPTEESYLPWKELSESDGLNFLPSIEIENPSIITPAHRLGWCMGLLTVADVSYLVAILMMLNPKWTFESLVEAKTVDIDGKPHLALSDLGMTFEIDKRRASTMKKEVLDDLSLEIISFLLEIRHKRSGLISKGKEDYLFLTVNQKRDAITNPSRSRVSIALSGYNSSKHKNGKEFTTCLSSYFPSLNQFGLGARTINHSKLRHTEGVLEWFRTGSVKAVSRKLGNTKKVSMEHYIPEPLLAAWNTRLVRRHQNLLIAAATMGEDYQLEAVDFSSLSELNAFLIGILSDKENKSPLLQYLREHSVDTDVELPSEGSLNIALSETALTALYTYRDSAKLCHVDVEILSKTDSTSGISPLGFIYLANHLQATLPMKSESKLSKMHKTAIERSNVLIKKIDWSDMFIKTGAYL
ncbi:hypothetical protein PAQ90_003430 [Vibrio parahaemolyticus]|nr:hypothetical protein [Vibrio parahaemolyticus]EKH9206905.1 hypothetical protein [Vibrio parahaemolyticus]